VTDSNRASFLKGGLMSLSWKTLLQGLVLNRGSQFRVSHMLGNAGAQEIISLGICARES